MAMPSSVSFEFMRGEKKLWMSNQDVTAKRLSSAFQVIEDTIYLKEEWGDTAIWPENGKFNLFGFMGGTGFEVMGDRREPGISYTTQPSYTTLQPSYTSQPSTSSTFKSASRPFAAKKISDKTSFACKIVMAEVKKTARGVSFEDKNQMYITLKEETANVPYISEKVQEKFGKNFVLVTGNGLPIEDEEGTRGSQFWKVPSRKLYAVNGKGPAACVQEKKKTKRLLESSSSESETPAKKKTLSNIHIKQTLSSIQEELNIIGAEISSVVSNIDASTNMLKNLTAVSQAMPLPPNIIMLVNDAFKCKVCLKLPMSPPVVATRCCNTLLGCSDCFNNWYSGDGGLDMTCPHCREPRGYAQTFQMKGLDEFLNGFKKVLSTESTSN